ncbi:flagellar hook-length control protein FliK [Butyrivibrio sp. WCD3002]|uniref:flagellar hook-length control protein FliK n=1 Tax=Butyrivibrio sp. WCD3002 TaxID=1280676 RepID=UPI00047EC703|nr:flagellar hook-length control protein FliK [Butyrivibrio sp. WCD3002]
MSNVSGLTSNRPLVQVDGRIVNQNASREQTSARSLETGERINGKIISLTDEGGIKNAQIKLGDDTVINAKLQEGMSLKEGQYVSFEVRGASNSQITLTPLYENTSLDPTALKALTAAGLEPTGSNLEMVKSMMENGMPIDKDSVLSMNHLVSANPDTSVSSLVQMKALNIPINDQNIQQFESYKNYEHQVVETMDSIMDELPSAFNELVQNGDGESAGKLYGDILKMISDGMEQMESTAASGNSTGIVGADNTAAGMSAAANGNGVNAEGAKVLLNSEAEGAVQNAANAEETVKNATQQGETLKTEEQVTDKNAGNNALLGSLEELSEEEQKQDQTQGIKNQTDNGKTAQIETNPKSVILSNDFANIIKSIQSETKSAGPEMLKLVMQANGQEAAKIDEAALMKELAKAYSESEGKSDTASNSFLKLFGSNEYNKLMKDSIRNQWMLEPSDVSSKENVESLYNRLNSQAKQLGEALTGTLGAESKAAQSATTLMNNIEFMNELNHMFNYVQLPLKMADQDAHGDLYVYSNGKRKFQPGETVSAILHLDLDNLGPLDVYVKMTDNNVKTNFYVADESVLDLIEAHIDILNERLSKRGYNMEAKMMLHTDMDNDSDDAAVSEMLDVRKMPVISMQSFDARA